MSSRQRTGVLPLLAVAVLLGVCSIGPLAAAREKHEKHEKQEILPTKSGAKTSTMIEGTIAAIDLTASPPRVAVDGGGGRHWLLPLDAKQTIVWRNGGADRAPLGRLKVGERIRAVYGKGSPPAAAEVLILLEEPPPPAPVPVAAPSATPHSSSAPDQDKARGGESLVAASRQQGHQDTVPVVRDGRHAL